MLVHTNVKMALSSLKQSKMHSFLTMFGIIVGVSSVVTMVSLGEGFKQQIRRQVEQTGTDTISIRPGRFVTRNDKGEVTGINLLNSLGGSVISEREIDIIAKTPDVKTVVPFSIVTGLPSIEGNEYTKGTILATTEAAPLILNQKIQHGYFFEKESTERNVAVIGRAVADELFKEEAPVGKALTIRGENFIVTGIFEEFPTININAGRDFNTTVFIPYLSAKRISGGNLPMFEVLVKPTTPDQVHAVADALHARLKADRSGQEDFTILKSEENVLLADNVLELATTMISGIAAISLLVGGIGIMNIMFALVTERTREIGIRKAIGANNQQILSQFLIEAVTLSVVGGVIGIMLSLLANAAFRIWTNLEPVINIPIMCIALGVSILVGMLSGVIPAFRAARKDPIEALRYH